MTPPTSVLWTISGETTFRTTGYPSSAANAAALAGLGICQNPWIGVREYLKRGELVEVLPKYRPRSTSHAKIVYPQRRYLAKRVRAFIDWVTPVLRAYFDEQE